MIDLVYDQPQPGQKRISGHYYDTAGQLCTFSCPIVYTNGEVDMPSTEELVLTTIEEANAVISLAAQ